MYGFLVQGLVEEMWRKEDAKKVQAKEIEAWRARIETSLNTAPLQTETEEAEAAEEWIKNRDEERLSWLAARINVQGSI